MGLHQLVGVWTGTPSTCVGPGPLETETQQVSLGPLQGHTPVHSHCPVPLGLSSPPGGAPTRGVLVQDPSRAEELVRQTLCIWGAGSLGVQHWPWRVGPHCSHRLPDSRCSGTAGPAGRPLSHSPGRTPAPPLIPRSGPPLPRGEQVGTGGGCRRCMCLHW